MLQNIIQMLGELNVVSVFVRLSMSVLFGGIIGIDRARKRRPAGLRTYMLVCLGSTLVMLTNQYIVQTYSLSDPSRLGAQVISGIGFLGAGTIIVTRHNQVIGLTTAAGLWASACMGLAIGIGFYTGAIIACMFILFIVMAMHNLDLTASSRSKVMEIYVEISESGQLSTFLTYMTNHGIKISYIEMVKAREKEKDNIAAMVTIRLQKRFDHEEVLDGFRKVEGISFVEEI